MTASPAASNPGRRCPVCSRPVEGPDHAPFCSRRCADVDLQRWFSGRYVVPGDGEAIRSDEEGEE